MRRTGPGIQDGIPLGRGRGWAFGSREPNVDIACASDGCGRAMRRSGGPWVGPLEHLAPATHVRAVCIPGTLREPCVRAASRCHHAMHQELCRVTRPPAARRLDARSHLGWLVSEVGAGASGATKANLTTARTTRACGRHWAGLGRRRSLLQTTAPSRRPAEMKCRPAEKRRGSYRKRNHTSPGSYRKRNHVPAETPCPAENAIHESLPYD